MVGFRAAFPDLNFWGAADLITPTSSYACYDHRKATARRLNDHDLTNRITASPLPHPTGDMLRLL
jgi:hypothetical protein